MIDENMLKSELLKKLDNATDLQEAIGISIAISTINQIAKVEFPKMEWIDYAKKHPDKCDCFLICKKYDNGMYCFKTEFYYPYKDDFADQMNGKIIAWMPIPECMIGKEMPIYAEKVNEDEDKYYYVCPSCGKMIGAFEKPEICSCGQVFKWG